MLIVLIVRKINITTNFYQLIENSLYLSYFYDSFPLKTQYCIFPLKYA